MSATPPPGVVARWTARRPPRPGDHCDECGTPVADVACPNCGQLGGQAVGMLATVIEAAGELRLVIAQRTGKGDWTPSRRGRHGRGSTCHRPTGGTGPQPSPVAARRAVVMAGSVVRVADRRRWPLAPLLDVSRLTRTRFLRAVGAGSHALAVAERRGLTDVQADTWSIRLGLHPILVWGWAWIEAAGADGPAHQVVADDLRARIDRGELRPGDVVPTARALGERFSVSRAAAARATAELRSEGLLTGGRGRPNRVAGAGPTTGDEQAREPAGVCRVRELLDEADAHDAHEPGCGGPEAVWCACDRPVHPECCPTCVRG